MRIILFALFVAVLLAGCVGEECNPPDPLAPVLVSVQRGDLLSGDDVSVYKVTSGDTVCFYTVVAGLGRVPVVSDLVCK